jgi:hypothetical protein
MHKLAANGAHPARSVQGLEHQMADAPDNCFHEHRALSARAAAPGEMTASGPNAVTSPSGAGRPSKGETDTPPGRLFRRNGRFEPATGLERPARVLVISPIQQRPLTNDATPEHEPVGPAQ